MNYCLNLTFHGQYYQVIQLSRCDPAIMDVIVKMCLFSVCFECAALIQHGGGAPHHHHHSTTPAPPLPCTLTVSSSFSIPVGICGTVLLIALNSAKSGMSSCIYTGIGLEASSCLARNLLMLAPQILAHPHIN